MYVDDDLAAFHSELWLSYWKSCNNCVWCWRHIQAGWYTDTNSLCINCLHILFIILMITLKWFSSVWDLFVHTLHVILTASIIRSYFNINT